jgi:hypothetical protein
VNDRSMFDGDAGQGEGLLLVSGRNGRTQDAPHHNAFPEHREREKSAEADDGSVLASALRTNLLAPEIAVRGADPTGPPTNRHSRNRRRRN